MRKGLKGNTLLKICTVLSAFGGVLLSLVCAQRDGYSHWGRRLLYFTAQSNLWIGGWFLLLLALKGKLGEKGERRLYLWKYAFTVSITVTGLVFCFLLAPFSDESYRPWTVCNLLTHIVTPVLAVVDFFTDGYRLELKKGQVFLPVLPPLCYMIFAGFLGALNTDFGRGVPYPYFFLNYRSPAGVFGFSAEKPFFIGSFYWIVAFALVVLGIAVLYARSRGGRNAKPQTKDFSKK